jgi:phage anti-repressor protein
MDLTPEVVFSLIRSGEEFPVDFDDAWRWIGYSRKNNAKAAFENAGFLGEIDFQILLINQQKSGRGRRPEKIKLTVDCFKSWAMMAGTQKGREVRQYFLRCERELKERIEQEQKNWRERQVKGYVLDQALPWDVKQAGQRPFVAEFYEHLYRIRGGDWAKRKPDEVNRPSCVGGWTNKFVYELFPGDVPKALATRYKTQESNFKKYEFLTQQVGRIHLVSHMTSLLRIMRLSPSGNWDRFVKNIQKAFAEPGTASAIQLEFDFLIELEEEWLKSQDEQAS